MRLLFKISGLAVIFSVCVLFGYSKSLKLKRRYERLNILSRSLASLSEHIITHSGEAEYILSLCFPSGLVYMRDSRAEYDGTYLKKEDTALLDEFFKNFGSGDTQSEYERARLYMKLICEKSAEAKADCDALCKLYNTLGILCGIFICIFFL